MPIWAQSAPPFVNAYCPDTCCGEAPALNKQEALSVLDGLLEPWRDISYEQLALKVGETDLRGAIEGGTGTLYQYHIQFFWDAEKDGAIRVTGVIDDSGWRAYFPLSRDILRKRD